jgi:hypothetical protein
MAHFARINALGRVDKVIVAEQEFIDTLPDASSWLQTSYNTWGNVHYGPDGKPDGKPALRKNYAAIGYTYDVQNDAFIAPKPFESWVLNPETFLWEAPVPYPTDGKQYDWDEELKQWVEIGEASDAGTI